MFDEEKISRAVTDILEAIGEDPHRDGLVDTPKRMARMYAELFTGLNIDPKDELTAGYELGHREMVVAKDITFYSMCEHHLLPFYGTAHIGYIPNSEGRVVGVGKLARVVEIVAARPQIQERMTTQIADAIMEAMNPSGVAVVVQAEHMCMMMRGVKKPGSSIITSAVRGAFLKRPEVRAEFFSLLHD